MDSSKEKLLKIQKAKSNCNMMITDFEYVIVYKMNSTKLFYDEDVSDFKSIIMHELLESRNAIILDASQNIYYLKTNKYFTPEELYNDIVEEFDYGFLDNNYNNMKDNEQLKNLNNVEKYFFNIKMDHIFIAQLCHDKFNIGYEYI